jgi:L-lactate dehydrogenase (cytochrome)
MHHPLSRPLQWGEHLVSNLKSCHNIADMRAYARRRLPRPVFDFLDGGAEAETTERRNTAAFDELGLVPRYLVDVSAVSTVCSVFGQTLAWPLICAPTGMSGIFHPEGELAVARAAAALGTLYGVATGSSYTLESVAAASAAPKFFLLYPYTDRGLMMELIDRAKAAGYTALCLMVDVPVIGKRERDLRSGFSDWPRWRMKTALSVLAHPRWAIARLRRGPLQLANLTGALQQGLPPPLDATMTWKCLDAIMSRWGGMVALKGVLSVEDARLAAEAGVRAILVSNHGGRQLDGAVSPVDVLPEIVEAVGDRLEVILDGGIRRGVHMLKALALGAKACSIGRPYLYGLAAGGEAGVTRCLSILRREFEMAMQLSGCARIDSIDERLIRRLN